MNTQHGDSGASWKERTKIHRQEKMSAEPYNTHYWYVRTLAKEWIKTSAEKRCKLTRL